MDEREFLRQLGAHCFTSSEAFLRHVVNVPVTFKTLGDSMASRGLLLAMHLGILVTHTSCPRCRCDTKLLRSNKGGNKTTFKWMCASACEKWNHWVRAACTEGILAKVKLGNILAFFALRRHDVVQPAYREHGARLVGHLLRVAGNGAKVG